MKCFYRKDFFVLKINIIEKVSKNKIGNVNKNGMEPEPNEEATFEYLTLFGFNVEVIKPTNTKKVKNPDILIAGAVWEVKTPISSKYYTIRNRFREASNQASKIIFDLRFIKSDASKAEKQIIKMFETTAVVRRMIVIKNNGEIVDMVK